MNNLTKILILAIAVGAAYWYFQPPSAKKIVTHTVIDTEAETIHLGDVVYGAEWGEPVSYAGDVRYIGRAYNKYAPFFTHDVIVTTGEFSDPEVVKIRPVEDGNTYWTSHKQPEGTFLVLHLVPAGLSVFEALNRIQAGDKIEVLGREEKDSTIRGNDGSMIKLLHDNHKFVLVTEVR